MGDNNDLEEEIEDKTNLMSFLSPIFNITEWEGPKFSATCTLFNGMIYESGLMETSAEAERMASAKALNYLKNIKWTRDGRINKVGDTSCSQSVEKDSEQIKKFAEDVPGMTLEEGNQVVETNPTAIPHMSNTGGENTYSKPTTNESTTVKKRGESSFSNGLGWDLFFRSDQTKNDYRIIGGGLSPKDESVAESIAQSAVNSVVDYPSSHMFYPTKRSLHSSVSRTTSSSSVHEVFPPTSYGKYSVSSSPMVKKDPPEVLSLNYNYVGHMNTLSMKYSIKVDYVFSKMMTDQGGFNCTCKLPFGEYVGFGIKKQDAKMNSAKAAYLEITRSEIDLNMYTSHPTAHHTAHSSNISKKSALPIGFGESKISTPFPSSRSDLHPKVQLHDFLLAIDPSYQVSYKKVQGPPLFIMWKVSLELPQDFGVITGEGKRVKDAETDCAEQAVLAIQDILRKKGKLNEIKRY